MSKENSRETNTTRETLANPCRTSCNSIPQPRAIERKSGARCHKFVLVGIRLSQCFFGRETIRQTFHQCIVLEFRIPRSKERWEKRSRRNCLLQVLEFEVSNISGDEHPIKLTRNATISGSLLGTKESKGWTLAGKRKFVRCSVQA